MNMANFEAWHFSAMFLLLMGAFSLFFYGLVTGLDRFASDEHHSYPRLARIVRIAKRCVPKSVTNRISTVFKQTVEFLERTIYTEDLLAEFDSDSSLKEVTYETKKSNVIPFQPVKTHSSVSTLVNQAGRLIESLDLDTSLLSLKQVQRIDSLADAILFLNDEYQQRQQDAATDSLFAAKLQHMVNELSAIHATIPYTQQQVAN